MKTDTTAATALPRFLARVQQGKDAQIANHSMTEAVFGGIALERGLVRVVRHRDHTRTYTLTAAGKAMLDKAHEIAVTTAPRYDALPSTIHLCELLRALRCGQDPAADVLAVINTKIGALLSGLDVAALPMPDRSTVRDACDYARGDDGYDLVQAE